MSDASSASPVAEGDIIAGKYRVARTLGAGGMGVVVAATHIELGHRVALKFLLPQAVTYPELIERFAREARAAAQIQSEHVARVTDVGTLDTGAPYMVMEYLEGQDLDDVLTLGGPLPVPTAVGHVLHACEALAEAHAMGIIHRDLKPANLFLANRPDGTSVIKVIDFGISKAMMTSDETGITGTSAMVGSPAYMAPEQIKAARSVDARADQWSLGVVLYELISAQKPFNAMTMAELVWVILDQSHASIRTLRPDVPEGLEEVINRCLAKDPAQRFADVAEVAIALAPYGPDWGRLSAISSAHLLGVGVGLRPTELSKPATTLSVALPSPITLGPSVLMPTLADASKPSLAVTRESGSPAQPVPAVVDSSVTNPPWSQSSSGVAARPEAPKPKKTTLLAAGGAVLVGALALAAALMTNSPAPISSVGLVQSSTPAPFPLPSASALASATPASEQPPLAPAATSSADPVSRPVPAAPRPAVATVASSVKARTPSVAVSPVTAAGQKCATVTYFDSDGVKHFKQECH